MARTAKKQLAHDIASVLEHVYPQAECALKWGTEPWRLLVMARLSAQCTDKKVNEVSVPLFEKYPTPEAMAEADIGELEKIIRPCGLYRMKAQSIKESCRQLVEQFGGELPEDMDGLLSLSGVGRKIANLLRGDVFGLGGVVVDTHFIRICGRLGFYPESEKNPQKIEKIFTPLLSESDQSDFCHRIVMFGREYCTAKNPACGICPLAELCARAKKRRQRRQRRQNEP